MPHCSHVWKLIGQMVAAKFTETQYRRFFIFYDRDIEVSCYVPTLIMNAYLEKKSFIVFSISVLINMIYDRLF
jgi:hypothetical protein